jgi:hypothetical protein
VAYAARSSRGILIGCGDRCRDERIFDRHRVHVIAATTGTLGGRSTKCDVINHRGIEANVGTGALGEDPLVLQRIAVGLQCISARG